MAKKVATDCQILYNGLDISGDLNQVSLEYSAEAKERTAFGASTKQRLAGLTDASLDMQGLWEAGTDEIDTELFAAMGATGHVVSVVPDPASQIAYSFSPVATQYVPAFQIGEIAAFGFAAQNGNTGPLVRGVVMQLTSTSITVTGAGTARQLGAVAAGLKLWAAIHVISGTGSIVFTVSSDDNSGMTSATSRIVSASITAPGGYLLALDGPVTDDWYQVSWVVTGGPFAALVAVGIK